MGKVKAVPQFSESISSFCKLMENAQRDYAWNYDEVNRMDRLTQDYLHKLELDGLDYKERAKVATQLAKCRQARRECKDTVEILEPLVQFLESDKGKNLLNLVREALGKTRKVEERMISLEQTSTSGARLSFLRLVAAIPMERTSKHPMLM